MAESFRFRSCPSEGGPTIKPFVVSEAVAVGDLVKISRSTGRVAVATTDSKLLVGLVVGPASHTVNMASLTNNVDEVLVTTDPTCVYAADDANARVDGANLDLAGTTGAMSLATDTNHDLMVAATSTATQETLFQINPYAHYSNNPA